MKFEDLLKEETKKRQRIYNDPREIQHKRQLAIEIDLLTTITLAWYSSDEYLQLHKDDRDFANAENFMRNMFEDME